VNDAQTVWIVDAHRDDGKHFVVHADEKLTAFVEVSKSPICLDGSGIPPKLRKIIGFAQADSRRNSQKTRSRSRLTWRPRCRKWSSEAPQQKSLTFSWSFWQSCKFTSLWTTLLQL
jgi:hypothetical protein